MNVNIDNVSSQRQNEVIFIKLLGRFQHFFVIVSNDWCVQCQLNIMFRFPLVTQSDNL